MNVGDSVTVGFPHPPGYRQKLIDLLKADGMEFTAVGNKNDSPPTYEGGGGARIWEIQATIEDDAQFKTYAPDVITVYTGIIDIGSKDFGGDGDQTGEQPKQDLIKLITTMTTKLPNAWVMVATLAPFENWPSTQGFLESYITIYNKNIREVVVPMFQAQGKRVRMVEMHAKNLADTAHLQWNKAGTLDVDAASVHLTDAGYTKMAGLWAEAIKSLGPDLAGGGGPMAGGAGGSASPGGAGGTTAAAGGGGSSAPKGGTAGNPAIGGSGGAASAGSGGSSSSGGGGCTIGGANGRAGAIVLLLAALVSVRGRRSSRSRPTLPGGTGPARKRRRTPR